MARVAHLLRFQAFGLAAITGCAYSNDAPLTTSAEVRMATGEVTYKRGRNGNTQLRVKVRRLAPAGQVESGASTYVVWAKPNSSADPQNIGVLRVGSERAGELVTKTPLRDLELIITPEREPVALRPTGKSIMSARIDMTRSR
jgi:hypothetical protein